MLPIAPVDMPAEVDIAPALAIGLVVFFLWGIAAAFIGADPPVIADDWATGVAMLSLALAGTAYAQVRNAAANRGKSLGVNMTILQFG
ncbi:hypothetical protein GCM10008942_36360 [Rhizomicrobium electricum]|uniref:EamA family transporter n=1 Tax=Rhizomicrobium electricum TaxID=480070 RepID=A0ABN1F7B2_9PROT